MCNWRASYKPSCTVSSVWQGGTGKAHTVSSRIAYVDTYLTIWARGLKENRGLWSRLA